MTINDTYSIANKFSIIFITLYNIFNVAWIESVSLHIDDEDRDELLSNTITTLFCLFSTACLGIIAVMCQVVVGLYSVVYTEKKLSGEIAKTSFVVAAINIFVDVVLICYIGLYRVLDNRQKHSD